MLGWYRIVEDTETGSQWFTALLSISQSPGVGLFGGKLPSNCSGHPIPQRRRMADGLVERAEVLFAGNATTVAWREKRSWKYRVFLLAGNVRSWDVKFKSPSFCPPPSDRSLDGSGWFISQCKASSSTSVSRLSFR